MLITEEYRQQQKQLHTDPNFGTASVRWAPVVATIINANGVTEVLDYGAGKLRLLAEIADRRLVDHKFKYHAFEPADPRYSERPKPAQMVVCLDVLEHIEPDLIDNVLDDIRRVTLELAFMTIASGPAKKTLPDGRNAHLIQEGIGWWVPKLAQRFDLLRIEKAGNGFLVLAAPLEA